MAGSLENRGKLRELIDKFQFVRLAPIVFLTSVVGVVVTYKKR